MNEQRCQPSATEAASDRRALVDRTHIHEKYCLQSMTQLCTPFHTHATHSTARTLQDERRFQAKAHGRSSRAQQPDTAGAAARQQRAPPAQQQPGQLPDVLAAVPALSPRPSSARCPVEMKPDTRTLKLKHVIPKQSNISGTSTNSCRDVLNRFDTSTDTARSP
eukprot:6085134-Pleurochrysis_carterae.AAC.2